MLEFTDTNTAGRIELVDISQADMMLTLMPRTALLHIKCQGVSA